MSDIFKRGVMLCCLFIMANACQAKTVLITGGLTGIGRETALAFKNDGWNVWATSRDPNKHAIISGINIRALDLTNAQCIKNLIKEINATDGRLDVLVNNAGYGILGPEEAISIAQARDLLEVNVLGPLQMIQASLPIMRKNNSGYIINISSSSGLRALPGLGMYSASKMALEGLSEALAAELSQWNIHVTLIEPGTINNDWVKNTPLAENLPNYPVYRNFTSKLQATLAKKASEVGQNQQEVAQLALRVAKNAEPNLRYQTNKMVADLANEVLRDPTGNKMRDKTLAFAKDMYQSKSQ